MDASSDGGCHNYSSVVDGMIQRLVQVTLDVDGSKSNYVSGSLKELLACFMRTKKKQQ